MTSADLMSRTWEAVQDKTCLSTAYWDVFLLMVAWKVHSFPSPHFWMYWFPKTFTNPNSKSSMVLKRFESNMSNLSCSDALLVARHGSIVVPLGTFAVPTYGALCGCGRRGLVFGFHIEPGLHHMSLSGVIRIGNSSRGVEILPLSCFEKVSWLNFKPFQIISSHFQAIVRDSCEF